MKRIVVVGGGIAGLATAYELRERAGGRHLHLLVHLGGAHDEDRVGGADLLAR